MNDNDRPRALTETEGRVLEPRALTETERRVLEAARDAAAWVPILDLDRVRRLGAGDIATVPRLVDAGLLAHDPGERAVRITAAGRHALDEPMVPWRT